jgi:predicted nucleotidyltransferase
VEERPELHLFSESFVDERDFVVFWRIAANRGAYDVRIFGSGVCDDASQSSDVDFLVDLEPAQRIKGDFP